MLFKAGPLPGEGMNPAAKADAFSAQLGCQPIGFNWEMLDPGDDLVGKSIPMGSKPCPDLEHGGQQPDASTRRAIP